MSAKNVRTKTDRKYFVQYFRKPEWVFSHMDKIQGGFKRPIDARMMIDDIMAFHNDFVSQHYRLVERTTIIIDEPLERFNKGW